MRKDQLILIDGSSMLVTSFHGNSSFAYRKTGDVSTLLQTKSGIITNGVYTMTKSLLNIIENIDPSHLVVCWDIKGSRGSRTALYPEYKANRKETKPELNSQFKLMQKMLVAMGIKQLGVENYEADDLIGTLSHRFENDIPVRIITRDKDAFQLITENTKVWYTNAALRDRYKEKGIDPNTLSIPNNVFEYGQEEFFEEYGYNPINIIDAKALEGDKSDNIPGVMGVGVKTSDALIKHFGELEKIYDFVESTDEEKAKKFFKERLGITRSPYKKLVEEKEMAYLSKELATINKFVDEIKDEKLEDMVTKLDKERTQKAFDALEFNLKL